MSQETVVRPEPIVKILMGLAVLSLITIAICQLILVLRPSQQPVLRRPILPIENRTTHQGMPPLPRDWCLQEAKPGRGWRSERIVRASPIYPSQTQIDLPEDELFHIVMMGFG